MAEQDNEQAGEALLQNARRTLREQPRRAIAGLCVVLLLGLLTAALASSLQRVSADDVCADAVAGAVKPMALSGSYAVDGGEERPYAARQALDAKGIGVEAVTVRGTLENDVAAGELVNMRLSSTACTVRVNGETVFSFDGIGDSEPAGEPLLGWIGFRSPGISTRDEVEIALSSAASYSVLGDYVIVLDSLCTGEPDALFVASVASHLPMFVSGILVLIAGLILLLIASVGYLIGVPKETGGLRFAFYVLIGGVWIFFCL
ncbi:conserved domain protein [Eggerthella sp. HGA1]|nr:conserved domain protein [Eggerthella sp. HGA1]